MVSPGGRPLPAVVEKARPIRQLLAVVGEAPVELVRDKALFARLLAFNALIIAADVLTLLLRVLILRLPLAPGIVLARRMMRRSPRQGR